MAKKTTKKKVGKKKRSSGKKESTGRRKKRAPISQAKVKKLAFESESIVEADQKSGFSQPLAEVLKEHPKIAAAWERGRYLRACYRLSAVGTSVDEAEQQMEIETGTLREDLKSDKEVAATWNQAKLDTWIELREGIREQALAGKAAAIKEVGDWIKREIAHPQADFTRLPVSALQELTGKSRQTVYEWRTKQGLPQNSDGTVNLRTFFTWFEEFTEKKNARKTAGYAPQDPLKQAKAEKLKAELALQKAELLPRDTVIAGQIARAQRLVAALENRPAEIALQCTNQPRAKIEQILTDYFADIRREMCSVPQELRLTGEAAEKYEELIEMLVESGK